MASIGDSMKNRRTRKNLIPWNSIDIRTTWNNVRLKFFGKQFQLRTLTINSRRNLSSSRAADVPLFEFDPTLFAVLMLRPFDVTTELVAFRAAAVAVPGPVIKFNGPRRSRRISSNCLVNASTLATAKLNSFSFSLNRARIESRSLPNMKMKKIRISLDFHEFDKY